MYVRFTVPIAHGGTVTRSKLAPGPFHAASQLWWRGDHEGDPILIAIRRELDWFNSNLPVPKRFGVKAKGRWYSDGICWFRDDARLMLRHMFALTSLVEECGVPISRRWTRDPGQLLYRDRWQVVAKPERIQLH